MQFICFFAFTFTSAFGACVMQAGCAQPVIEMSLQLPDPGDTTNFDLSCVGAAKVEAIGSDPGDGRQAQVIDQCVDVSMPLRSFADIQTQFRGKFALDVPDSGLAGVQLRGVSGRCSDPASSTYDSIFYGGAPGNGKRMVIAVTPGVSCNTAQSYKVRVLDLLALYASPNSCPLPSDAVSLFAGAIRPRMLSFRIEGPGDMVRLGEQLDWLRERLITLEAQKTRFLQHMSHELKTPLTALREGSDLLSSGVVGNLNAEQREIARILQENSIELRKLIEGLLNYSAVHAKASYLDARIVPLREVVKRVVNDRKLAIVAKGLRLELNCENVTAYCDEEKIRVMLDNLLSNAVKYSPERGAIAIKLYHEHGDVVFEVRDEGPGIPAPEREKVFEAFYRGTDVPVAAIKGSGLGLSIVKEYVELHRGSVEILDGPGAHFRIRFPRKPDVEEAA